MPLRESPTSTTALAAAHRRNAQQSTVSPYRLGEGRPGRADLSEACMEAEVFRPQTQGKAAKKQKNASFEAGMLLKTKGEKMKFPGDPNILLKPCHL